MKRRLSLLLLLALAAVAAGCGGGGTPSNVPSDSVALVGSKTIPRSDFEFFLDQTKRNFEQSKRPFPKAGSQSYENIKDEIMRYLVQTVEYEQAAKDLGVHVDEKKVDQRIQQYKQRFFKGSDKVFAQQLKAHGYTEERFRENIRNQVLSEEIYAKVTSGAKVSNDDVKKYYDQHKAEYTTRNTRHILVKTKSQADKLYARLKAGANFVALAKKYSTDLGTKARGGAYTAYKSPKLTDPSYSAAAFALKTGQFSKPVHSQFGWHLIEAMGPVKVTPLTTVQTQIRSQLEQTEKNDAMRKWVNDTKKDFSNKVKYAPGFAPQAPVTQTTTG